MLKRISFFVILLLFSCSKELISYTLTATANPAEGGSVSPSSKQYDAGDVATITATPSSEYLFERWSGSASGTSPSITVTMDSDKAVVANFIKKQYPLTIEIEGEGSVTETVIKQGLATDYNSGTIVELKAVPEDGWEFIEWSGDLTGSENPKQITIDKAKTVNVKFAVKPELSIDFNNTNGMLISKAKTSSANGTSNNNYNAKLINFNGELTELVIPGSKSHTLNITRALELNEQFLLLFGNLFVEYEGDVNGDGENGDKINYNNIIIDKATGDFYEAGAGFGGIRKEGLSNPWLNHMFQYDSKGNIFYNNQEGLNNSNVQIIDKLNLNINEEKLTSNREKINIIAGDYNFYSIVGDDGILYFSRPDYDWKIYGFRNNNGKTYILNQSGESPIKTELGNTDGFFIQGKNKEILMLTRIGIGADIHKFALHKFLEKDDKTGIEIKLITELYHDAYPKRSNYYGPVGWAIVDGFTQGPMYFKRTDSENEQVTNHIIINSNYGNEGTLITQFKEGETNEEYELNSLFSDKLNESQFFKSFNNEAYASSDECVLFAVNQKIVKFDFDPLKVEYLIEDSGYEFYRFAPASDDEFYFYGLSYDNGKRTLGKINLEGVIEIIEQFDNDIDMHKLIKIGGTN